MWRYVGIAGVLVLSLSAWANAATLDLWPIPPDVSSQFVTVNYTLDPVGPLGTLTADGFLDNLTTDGVNGFAVDNGESHITALIDEATGMFSSGTITLTGDVTTDVQSYSGLLLEGTIFRFGFIDGAVDKFEFEFFVTDGELMDIWTDRGGAIVSSPTGFAGVFTEPFTTTNVAASEQDTFSIPAPAAVWGIPALLMMAVALFRRRRFGA